MSSLASLINRTFLADMRAAPFFYNRREVLMLLTNKPDRSISWDFDDGVVAAYQWRPLGKSLLMTIENGKKHYALKGCGLAVGDELRACFADAGFGDTFTFVADEERKKIAGTTYPVYDPKTTPIAVTATALRGRTPDYGALDDEVAQFLTMAELKRAG